MDSDNQADDPKAGNNAATVTLPVVWRELHIIPWGQTKHLKWITGMPREFPRNRTDFSELEYFRRRGIQVLGYMYTVERNFMKKLTVQETIDVIVERAGEYAAAGASGLIIDETGSYGTPDGFEWIRRFGLAYDAVRERYPRLKVYNWIAGPLHREEIEIGARNGHIMMGECYEQIHGRYGPSWRTRLRSYIDKLGPRNIIALGCGSDCGRQFGPQIESSVRIIRELGPDMPGIQYYQVPYLQEGESYSGSIHEFVDGLTFLKRR